MSLGTLEISNTEGIIENIKKAEKTLREKVKHISNCTGALNEYKIAIKVTRSNDQGEVVKELTNVFLNTPELKYDPNGYIKANQMALNEYNRIENFVDGQRIWLNVEKNIENKK